jgi:hypothetical protein
MSEELKLKSTNNKYLAFYCRKLFHSAHSAYWLSKGNGLEYLAEIKYILEKLQDLNQRCS